MAVFRIYVEKKPAFAVEADSTRSDIRASLGIDLKGLRLLNRYDVEGIDGETFETASRTIFSEPPVDVTYPELPEVKNGRVLAVEYLPGQFDQRADSCEQCIQIMTQGERPAVRTAKVDRNVFKAVVIPLVTDDVFNLARVFFPLSAARYADGHNVVFFFVKNPLSADQAVQSVQDLRAEDHHSGIYIYGVLFVDCSLGTEAFGCLFMKEFRHISVFSHKEDSMVFTDFDIFLEGNCCCTSSRKINLKGVE